jgi:hypothetical protein
MTDDRLRDAYAAAMAARAASAPARAACPSAEALHALVHREGRETDRLATLDHAMACPHCRRELELLRAIARAGEESGAIPARGRPRWPIYVSAALAASLALAMGLGSGRRPWDVAPADVMRGSGADVRLAAPAADATVPRGASLVLAWHPVPGARDYVVEVMAGDGTVAFTGTTADSTLSIPPTGSLPPGEYRWMVRARTADGAERLSPARLLRVR